jgi:hypothetical protein
MSTISVSNNKKTRINLPLILVFSFFLVRCTETNTNKELSIQWEENKAVGIIIPSTLLADVSRSSIEESLHLHLAGNDSTSIFGKHIITDDSIIFRPLIPFTPGLRYEIHSGNKLLGEIIIPLQVTTTNATVLSVFPGADTLPENLLKIYISFSKPMQEGHALEHIRLLKNGRDTLPSVFLDLQPELWNNERTMLTLWLDPGRIKRDLVPNKTMGPPLQKGQQYRLIIQPAWRSAEGDSTVQTLQKDFTTGSRDDLSPNPETWTINTPESGTAKNLEILFHEALDYVLAKNAIHILAADGKEMKGAIEVTPAGTIFRFIPEAAWKPGVYTISIEARLEDLAGNNLNRPFDNDISHKKDVEDKDIFKRSFVVK